MVEPQPPADVTELPGMDSEICCPMMLIVAAREP